MTSTGLHRKRVALTPQSLDVPMFVGQDSSIDPRVLQPGSSAVVENGRLFYRGQVRKRFGYTAQANQRQDGSFVTAGQQVFSGGSVLFQHDGTSINSWSPGSNKWQRQGSAIAGQLTGLSVVQTVNTVVQAASACSAAFQVIMWTEQYANKSSLFYCVIDAVTGAQIVPRFLLSSAAQAPQVFQVNGNFYMFWGDYTADTVLYYAVIPSGAPSTYTAQVLTGFLPTSNTQFAVLPISTGFLIASDRLDVSGNVQYNPATLTFAGVLTIISTVNTGLPPGANTQPSLVPCPDDGSGNILGALCFYNNYYPLKSSGTFDPVTTAFSGQIHNASGAVSSLIFVEYTPYGVVQPYSVAYSGGSYVLTPLDAPQTAPNGLHFISRAFSTGAASYIWCVVDASYQSLNVLLDQTNSVVAIAGANGTVAGWDGGGNSLSHITNDGAGNYTFVTRSIRQINNSNGVITLSSIGAVLKNLALALPRTYAQQIDSVTYLGNCAPQIYDGSALTEWGFYFYPELSVSAAAGTGLMTGGTYQLSAVYSWYDATGKIWRSATSLTQSVTVPANGAITITYPYLWLTTKQNVTVEFYCTANIGGQTGTVLYLAASVQNQLPDFSGGQPINTAIASYVLNVADATIATGQLLYTSGGVPSYLTAPSMTHMSSSGLRLYATSGEDNQIYVSNPATPGVPINYVSTQSVAVESSRGGLVASQPMDGNLWIATQDAWFLTNADTTSLQSSVITFNPPAKAAFGDGCQSAPSVFSSAAGIYYQSRRGIELINRGQAPVFVGEPVKNVTGQVVDCFSVPGQQQIRFVYSGLVLCYDYERQTWLQQVLAAAPTLVSGCRWNGLGVLGTPDGLVRLENTSSFLDDGVIPIILRIQTPWLRVGGLTQWGKTWSGVLLGEYESSHTIQVQIAYGQDPTWIDTLSISGNPTGTAFGSGTTGQYGQQKSSNPPGPIPPAKFGINSSGNPYQFLFDIPRGDEQAIKFEFTTQNSTGEDCRWDYVTLIYGMQPGGVVQVPTARKFG